MSFLAAQRSTADHRLHVATFECASCGSLHIAADGVVPVGWTARHANVWCTDCTRAGIPVRELRQAGSRRTA